MYANSFLQAHGERTGFPQKIGLYTGPFLVSVRESIRINSCPISKELFTKYFYELWDKLSNHTVQNPETYRPGYIHVRTLLAFHIFFSERVDVAIFETNSGGANDATNVVKPAVVGITKLDIDHVNTLGSTIESIAWHKSGIFKRHTQAFSSPQDPRAAAVLENRATEASSPLAFIDVSDCLSPEAFRPRV